MSTDPSPELCTNFEGASFDPSTRWGHTGDLVSPMRFHQNFNRTLRHCVEMEDFFKF